MTAVSFVIGDTTFAAGETVWGCRMYKDEEGKLTGEVFQDVFKAVVSDRDGTPAKVQLETKGYAPFDCISKTEEEANACFTACCDEAIAACETRKAEVEVAKAEFFA